MIDEDTSLLPCPFCGCEPRFETYGGTACAVVCKTCRCGTPVVSLVDGARAVESWNRRAGRTCHDVARSGESFRCSECGTSVEVERGDSRLYVGDLTDDFDYCPRCGAMVVTADADR